MKKILLIVSLSLAFTYLLASGLNTIYAEEYPLVAQTAENTETSPSTGEGITITFPSSEGGGDD